MQDPMAPWEILNFSAHRHAGNQAATAELTSAPAQQLPQQQGLCLLTASSRCGQEPQDPET